MDQLGAMPDVFRRSLLWGSLWDSVRQADLAPRNYIALAAKLLPAENRRIAGAEYPLPCHHGAAPLCERGRAQSTLSPRSKQLPQIKWHSRPIRACASYGSAACVRLAETPAGLAKLKALLNGQLSVPGIDLRPLDRWNMVTALIALGDPEADAMLAAEKQLDQSGDGQEYAYVAQAARPDGKTKQKYFEDYLHDSSRPEDWVEQSLGAFNYWNQSTLTEPYLQAALEALPQIKRDRKIFFLVDWLDAFLGGQQSPAAQAQVHQYLKTANIDQDLRLKILQVVDELDRTVAIRQKFP